MRSLFFMPPLPKISGGMAVIAQLAAHLAEAGYEAMFVTQGKLPENFTAQVPVLQLHEANPSPADRWIVPEGWPNALWPGLRQNAKCAVYVQNWAFLHGHLPEGMAWSALPVRMIAVSQPVARFIRDTTGFIAPIIPPAVDSGIFYPPTTGASARSAAVAWMPRKNRGLAKQIRAIFEAILKKDNLPLPKWLAIENQTPTQVAGSLRAASLFLATGFPEGFGLPPLEAMACGCLVAGFTGMGGWDYMRQGLAGGYTPHFEIESRPWGPNGFFAADGDTWGAALALRDAWVRHLSGKAQSIVDAGLATAAFYAPQRQKKALLTLWSEDAFWN